MTLPDDTIRTMTRARKMVPCFETARMYTGPFPALPLDSIYGITSFEVEQTPPTAGLGGRYALY